MARRSESGPGDTHAEPRRREKAAWAKILAPNPGAALDLLARRARGDL